MSVPPPSFPPPEPLPQGPLSSPQVTPEVAPVADGAPIAAAPPKRSYVGLIVGGSILVFLLLAGGVTAGAMVIVNAAFVPAPVIQELIEGDAGSAEAKAPLTCPDDCFSLEAINGTISDQTEFAQAGVPIGGSWVTTSTLSESYEQASDEWLADRATPDSCFFVYYAVPMVQDLGTPPEAGFDVIEYTGRHSDRRNISFISQSIRLFDTSASAVEHMARLNSGINACDSYSFSAYGNTMAIAVTPAPAITVPDSVAAVGWVESSEGYRRYIVDIQKSNLIVRTYASTDGGLTEEEFRDFVTGVAQRVGSLKTPAPYVEPTGCKQECTTVDEVVTLSPGEDELGVLGASLAPDPANAALVPTPSNQLWNDATLAYRNGGGDPAVCFFAQSTAPLGRETPDYNDEDLTAVPLGTFSNSTGATLTQVARVYKAQLIAGRYIGSLRSPILQCASYSFDDGTGVRNVTLTPEEFDTGSDAVDSAGWVESWDGHRRTVVNLSYSNVTMRLTLDETGASSVSADAFADYVRIVAARMEATG